jgi:hypothetical protein
MRRLSGKLTYANVVATLALFIAIGGASAFAATQLGKNTVGPKQLKKNSITTAKVKKEAITAVKVKNGTLTGAQINLSTLGAVPNAQTANLANTLAPSEAWHLVGSPGEPGFQNGWQNTVPSSPPITENVAFYKDQVGVVHLKGLAAGGKPEQTIFQLPAGYRPASGKVLLLAAACSCEPGSSLGVFGSGNAGDDGAVQITAGSVSLDGVSFRAES